MTHWAPVVYGRTAASDTWWRAVPEGLNEHGWLGRVIHSALARGHELKQRPRFLLAQDGTHRIVGVACRAGELSEDMRSDGSRELFCFVGWAAARTGVAGPAAPEFDELRRCYSQWAAPVYTRMLVPVWHASATADVPSARTLPEEVPWLPPARLPKPGLLPEKGMWAEEAWPVLWTAVQAGRDPFTCVLGWQHVSSARFEEATHLGAADAPPRQLPGIEYAGQRVPTTGAADQDTPEPLLVPEGPSTAFALPVVPAPLMPPVPPVPSGITAGQAVSQPAGLTVAQLHVKPLTARPPVRRLRTGAGLAAAAVTGAAVAGLIAVIVSPAGPPAPSGPPAVLQVVITASAAPGSGSVAWYRDGALSPGPSAARIAVWTSGTPIGPASCAGRVATAPALTPVTARPGLRLCVRLMGQPARYGMLEITAVTTASMTATAVIWP
jgi:hypothetical protein